MDAADIETNRAASASVMTMSPSRRKRGTMVASIGARRLPAGVRVSIQHMVRAGHHVGPELRGPGRPRPSDLERPGPADGGPAVVPMPPGQLDQLVEDPRLLGPRPPLVAGRQLLGHCLALPHRKLHDVGRNPGRHRLLGSPLEAEVST